ncbi:MAG: hypothetical protein GY716_22800 [bacterium]|nr:hypothetical protein [bacterium]
MATDDRCVTIQPYFVIKNGEEESVRSYLEKFVELTRSEPGCLYYGFSTCGDKFHCREGYADGDAALAHLGNVGPLLQELLGSGKAELTDLQVHGPEQELAKLREPMAELNPGFWVLEYGFRN